MTTIGMIVPPADGAVPPEPPELYPQLRFIARGLALPELTPDGYDSVIDHVADLARQLKNEGAEAVSLMGTSLSFYRGPAGNAQVIAVATAYTDTVNQRLRAYLTHEGFDILSLDALRLTEVAAIQSVGDAELIALGTSAARSAPDAEALFISCGGLRTLPVITPLEEALGIPVISSATAGAWGAVRLAGESGRAQGFGRLFQV